MSTAEPSSNTVQPNRKENQRVVHFTVPESVFNRAKAKAHLTGVPWKVFLQNLMEEGAKLSMVPHPNLRGLTDPVYCNGLFVKLTAK